MYRSSWGDLPSFRALAEAEEKQFQKGGPSRRTAKWFFASMDITRNFSEIFFSCLHPPTCPTFAYMTRVTIFMPKS
jgi:hypothetical protein